MTAPTVAQVRAYLEHLPWHPNAPLADGATVWWQYPNATGWHVVIPAWPDDDTRLLERSSAIHVLAEVAQRSLDEIVADILVDQEDFEGCTRRCCPNGKPPADWVHTLKWGDCGKAEPPPVRPATFDIPVTWTADDGYPSAGWVPVPLTLFAPWAEHLPPEDQHDMLAEVAAATAADRAGIAAEWQRTAEQLADPLRREVLLGENVLSDFVEAPRPGGAK